MGGSSKRQTVGYRYYLGAHMVLGHGPFDAVTHIIVSDRQAWSGSSTGGTITINSPGLFGGESREGGVSGEVDICMGESDQMPNPYLVEKIGGNVPSFRGVVSVILKHVYVGLNPYMKPWKFRARRIMKSTNGTPQWYPEKAAINTHDMNPIHIIRECLVDSNWGCGYTANDVDTDDFQAAADRLHSEGFGLSFLWEKEGPIEDFIVDVLRHIDAGIYVDRMTGKFRIKLIRDDYVEGSLLTLDESNIISVEDLSTPTQAELVNTVTVNYWDRSTGNVSSVTVQDIALIASQGGANSSTIDYTGCTSGGLAVKLASRDLKALSSSAFRCTIKANRNAGSLNVGSVFKFSWPNLNVYNAIMRVVSIKFGAHESGEIELEAVQDVFSLGESTYAAPPPSEWVDPISVPVAVPYRKVLEAPYMALVLSTSQREVDSGLADSNATGYVVGIGVKPTPDTINAEMWADAGSGYQAVGVIDFCPTATLADNVSPTTTTISISNGRNLEDVEVGSWAQIDDELVKVTSVSPTSVVVGRGVFDTVPAPHTVGARIYFWEDYNGFDSTEYVSGETVGVKMLSVTGKGTLPLGTAPSNSVTLNRRAFRPYPPGNWKIADSYFPALLLDTPITTTWAHRHRTQQTGLDYVTFTAGSIGPESGTTYSIRLYNNDTNALVHSVDGLTGTSYSGFPSPTGTYNFRMELWSRRDGYDSTYKQTHVFQYINVTYLNTETGDLLITEAGDNLTTE